MNLTSLITLPARLGYEAARRTLDLAAAAGRATGLLGGDQPAPAATSPEPEPTRRPARPKPGMDDVTLTRKVETEVFRGPDVPKGDIVVDAVDGVVTLRGQVPAASMKDELERKARDVTGVRDVQNLLHLPGEDAPMLDASAAGRSAR